VDDDVGGWDWWVCVGFGWSGGGSSGRSRSSVRLMSESTGSQRPSKARLFVVD